MILPVHITTHPFIIGSRENPTAWDGRKEKRPHVFVKDKAQFCSAAAFGERDAISAQHQRESCEGKIRPIGNGINGVFIFLYGFLKAAGFSP